MISFHLCQFKNYCFTIASPRYLNIVMASKISTSTTSRTVEWATAWARSNTCITWINKNRHMISSLLFYLLKIVNKLFNQSAIIFYFNGTHTCCHIYFCYSSSISIAVFFHWCEIWKLHNTRGRKCWVNR